MTVIQRTVTACAALTLALGASTAAAHDISGEEFAFNPDSLTVSAGEEVEITFTNDGNLSHNLTIPAFDVETETIQAGNSTTVTFTADQTGTFDIICSVSGHKQAGMVGELTVE